MFNQLLKFGALLATGRFLKPRFRGLFWVAASWLVLWFVHSEYVNYVQLSGNTDFVLHATIIKTSFYALSIAIYVLMVERKLWPKPLKMPPAKPAQGLAAPANPSAPPSLPPDDDGFNFLRDKPTLKK